MPQKKNTVHEIYHNPNSNSALSLEQYDTILSKLYNIQNVIIGSDLDFDFPKIATHILTSNSLSRFNIHRFVCTNSNQTYANYATVQP